MPGYRILPTKADADTEHIPLNIDIFCVCVVCATGNTDNPSLTLEPICSDCSNTYTWDQLDKLFCSCQLGVNPERWRAHKLVSQETL